jgi:serine/threonine-protein kinase
MPYPYRLVFLLGIVLFAISCNKTANPVNPNDSTTLTSLNITITSIRPVSGPYKTIDTITGLGLEKIATPDSVLINGHKVTIIRDSADQVIVEIPILAGTGNVDIWYKGKMYQGPVFIYDSVLYVTTIAGTTDAAEVDGKGTAARFFNPAGIALDHFGNTYVAEGGNTIRKIDTGANVSILAGSPSMQAGYLDGTGTGAMFNFPYGLCMGPDGYLYVGEGEGYRVRRVSTSGVVTTFAGATWDGIPADGSWDGNAATATFNSPWGVASDQNGNIYVADINNNKIRKITSAGVVSSLAGGDYYTYGQQDGIGSSALFYEPRQVAVDPSGNVFVIDNESHFLRKITPDGTVTTLLGPYAPSLSGVYDLLVATAVATDKHGNVFFSYDGGIAIAELKADGTLLPYAVTGAAGYTDGPIPLATFGGITGMVVDDSGTIYVTDKNRVRRVGWH